MSAVSIRLTPASRQMSICCRAALTSRWPTGLAHPVPPNPIVPRVMVEIIRPDRPSCRYSMTALLCFVARRGESFEYTLGGARVPPASSPTRRTDENASMDATSTDDDLAEL